jgi:hypothetical protein
MEIKVPVYLDATHSIICGWATVSDDNEEVHIAIKSKELTRNLPSLGTVENIRCIYIGLQYTPAEESDGTR